MVIDETATLRMQIFLSQASKRFPRTQHTRYDKGRRNQQYLMVAVTRLPANQEEENIQIRVRSGEMEGKKTAPKRETSSIDLDGGRAIPC